jgi:glucose/arabinose dehydrogenase
MSLCPHQDSTTDSPYPEAVLSQDFCAFELAVTVDQPRSIRAVERIVVENGVEIPQPALLVLERGSSSVILVYGDDNGIMNTREVVASASDLNHGLALSPRLSEYLHHLYASSSSTVYRWTVDAADNFRPLNATPEIIVTNIDADGQGGAPFGHQTRTLVLEPIPAGSNSTNTTPKYLYVSVGSVGNIDSDSFRSRIRRFDLETAEANGAFPLDFVEDGVVFADGLRNEVGLSFDRHGILWGVENSADRLERDDLGGFITNDNPAEELNRFNPLNGASWPNNEAPHYGYPYCWTEFGLPEGVGKGPGTRWAWPTFLEEGTITDEACQNVSRFTPPTVVMQAHSAPLGLTFYNYAEMMASPRPEYCQDVIPFPAAMDGHVFIGFHGSWNRETPTGYKVVTIAMDAATGLPVASDLSNTQQVVDFFAHKPPNATWSDGLRPVDVAFDACGRLYMTSDGSMLGDTGPFIGSKILRFEYTVVGESSPPSDVPSMLPRVSSAPSDVPTFSVVLDSYPPSTTTGPTPATTVARTSSPVASSTSSPSALNGQGQVTTAPSQSRGGDLSPPAIETAAAASFSGTMHLVFLVLFYWLT